jgi:hypothetical protein
MAGPERCKLILVEVTTQKPTLPPNKVPGILGARADRRERVEKGLQFQELIVSSPGHGNSETAQQVGRRPQRKQRNGRVPGKWQEMTKLFRVNDPINNILPETDSVPLVRIANGNTSKLSVKPKDVFPPEGALLSCQMGNNVIVVFVPDESNPLNICLAIEFVQLLEKKRVILNAQIDYTKPTFVFRLPDQIPSGKIVPFTIEILASPETVLPVFIYDLDDSQGELQRTHVISGERGDDRVD